MEGVTTASAAIDAAKSIMTLAGEALTVCIQNPVLVLFIGASLVGVAFGLVKRMKSAAM